MNLGAFHKECLRLLFPKLFKRIICCIYPASIYIQAIKKKKKILVACLFKHDSSWGSQIKDESMLNDLGHGGEVVAQRE